MHNYTKSKATACFDLTMTMKNACSIQVYVCIELQLNKLVSCSCKSLFQPAMNVAILRIQSIRRTCCSCGTGDRKEHRNAKFNHLNSMRPTLVSLKLNAS